MKLIPASIPVVIAISFPIAGCDTGALHELNVNPQALNQINMNFLFTAAELSAASGGYSQIEQATNNGYCAYWIQHLALGGAGDKYFVNIAGDELPWDVLYGDPLKNLAEVLRQTGPGGFEEGRRPNTRQAARILKAFLFHRLTDYYGNIPYSEALKLTIHFPKYDHQSTIYADLLNELDEAATEISVMNPDDGFTDADLIYKGDVSKWRKWSYSLMLRLAMRVSNVDPQMSAAYVTKAFAGGVFTSNADNAWVPMATGPSLWFNGNGISNSFIATNSLLSKTLVDKLKKDPAISTDDDPRLMFISGGVGGNKDPLVQRGVPNGLDLPTLMEYLGTSDPQPRKEFSVINTRLLDTDEPYLLMQFAEVSFLLAESVERRIGTVAGSSRIHFETGVKGAIDLFTAYDPSFVADSSAVTNYLIELDYTEGASNALELIGDQLWISKWFNWWDAWADWRRTGYPVLVPVNYPGNQAKGNIPRKLILPMFERANNAENVAEGATTSDDAYENLARVWWDGGN